MSDATSTPRAVLGWLGFIVGAVALILTIVVFWAGPFAPQQTVGVSLGELAAEIAKSAARSVAGQQQPAPVAPARDIDDYLKVGVGTLAGLAIVLGVASVIRRERQGAAVSGIALGGLAVGFQLFAWTVMMIAGTLILASVIYVLRDTFGDIFGGLSGG